MNRSISKFPFFSFDLDIRLKEKALLMRWSFVILVMFLFSYLGACYRACLTSTPYNKNPAGYIRLFYMYVIYFNKKLSSTKSRAS